MGGYHADLKCVCGDALIELHDGSLICDGCHRRYVRTDSVVVSGNNPRKHFDDGQLQEMCDSIREHGILEALLFRPCPYSVRAGMFELVAGERRFRSACLLDLKVVPADIRKLTDEQVADIMLIENMQRVDLAPLEEAAAIQRRLDQGGITQADLAAKLGKSQAWVANRLRLLQAPDEVKDLLISREISPKHVISVLPYARYPVLRDIVKSLKEKIDRGETVSVKKFDDLIEQTITWRFNSETVLNLDDPPYEHRNYTKYFDLSKCDGCEHIVKFPDPEMDEEEIERYCLNRRCWKDVINRARQKYEKVRKSKLASMKVINTRDLAWGTYEYLKYADFDKSGCDGCEQRRLDSDDSEICIDVDCFRKKKSAHSREVNAVKRAEKDRVWDAIDAWLETLDWSGCNESVDDTNSKFILRTIMHFGWQKSVKFGLAPWIKREEGYGSELVMLQRTADELEGVDRWRATMRVLVAMRFEAVNDVNLKALEQYVPPAVPFYQPAEEAAT